jgi:hypothetical protein
LTTEGFGKLMNNFRLIAIGIAAAALAAMSLVAATSSPAPSNLGLIAGAMQTIERASSCSLWRSRLLCC